MAAIKVAFRTLFTIEFETDYLFDVLETLSLRILQRDGLTRIRLPDLVAKVRCHARANQIGPLCDDKIVTSLFEIIGTKSTYNPLRYRVNRIMVDGGGYVSMIDAQFWFGDRRLPSVRPPLQNPRCPPHVAKYIFEQQVKASTIKGYWFNLKKGSGLALQPLGTHIIKNYGCFLTYLIRSCRHFRPQWSESEVKQYEAHLLKMVSDSVCQSINRSRTKSLDMSELVYFTFDKCPLVADDELIMAVMMCDQFAAAKFAMGDGALIGCALRVGAAIHGRLLDDGTKMIEQENGELDDDWNEIDPVEQFNERADLRDLTIQSDDESGDTWT